MTIKILDRSIGLDHEPFIIAEMSGNHNGSLDRALEIVRAAARSGADCLKFQTYTADTMTLDVSTDDFLIKDVDSLWADRQLYELYEEAHTPWEWHKALFDEAQKLGVVAFSTPFDETAVDFLETLDVPMYKIASFEIVHLPLIRKVASTGKPMIMSTGMATEEEIQDAVDAARGAGAKDIILLKCTSAYPAPPSDANLQTIEDLRTKYGVESGLSDHTLGVGVAVAAVTMGATVIEKHFTLSRAEGGVDSAFSLEPHEMRQLKEDSKAAWEARGRVKYGASESDQKSKQFRPSVWPQTTIKAGERFTADNLKICRPGQSLAPKFYDDLIGTVASRDLSAGDRLGPQDLEG
jgi:N-acetylneuraminate synthase